jgi:hypothetical protein
MKLGDIYSIGTNGIWETNDFSVSGILPLSTMGYWQGSLLEVLTVSFLSEIEFDLSFISVIKHNHSFVSGIDQNIYFLSSINKSQKMSTKLTEI